MRKARTPWQRFAAIIDDLLLSGFGCRGGSRTCGILHELAARGTRRSVLSAHVSNLDVPALYTLLRHCGEEALFEDIIFIAGRKLTEGCKSIKSMAEVFSRVVISAKSSKMSEQEVSVGLAINKAAGRSSPSCRAGEGVPVLSNRHEDPDGRAAGDHGLREIYNYLRKFEYCVFCGVRGNILPPRDDVDMIDEFPRRDTIVYTFGEVRGIAGSVGGLDRAQVPRTGDRPQAVRRRRHHGRDLSARRRPGAPGVGAVLLAIALAYLGIGAAAGVFAGLLGVGGGLVIVPLLVIAFTRQGLPGADADASGARHFDGEHRLHFDRQPAGARPARRGRLEHRSEAYARDPGGEPYPAPGWPPGSRRFFSSGSSWHSSFSWPCRCFWTEAAPSREIPGMAGTGAVGGEIVLISSLVGIGGGSLSVPFMAWCNVPVRRAIGTSAAIGLPIALAGAAGYVINGLGAPRAPGVHAGVCSRCRRLRVSSSRAFRPHRSGLAWRAVAPRPEAQAGLRASPDRHGLPASLRPA